MTITDSIFKAYDIRGIVGTELTTPVAEAVGRALADFLPTEGPVCVGYDMRPDSVELAAAVRSGLMRQGREVIDIGCVSSDMIYFAVVSLNAAGGAMVTASHNPGKYNGIKLCQRAARPIGIESGLKDIRETVVSDAYAAATQPGTQAKHNVMEAWVKHALSFSSEAKLKPFHIAVDAGNGMGGAVMPFVERSWPLKVERLYYELDGTFPNHAPNPMVVENLADLASMVVGQKLDFGIAFDGDGDRAFLVDETGRQVSGSVMTAMIAEYLLKRTPGAAVLFDARLSRVMEEIVTSLGGTSHRTKVGHAFIMADMDKYDAIFAGELAGHFYFKDNFNADSGLIAAIVAIAALGESGLNLSQLVKRYEKYPTSGEINFEVADKASKLKELSNAYADGEHDLLEGLTVRYPDWWFNARTSNTEPLLRLNVEADSQELLEEKLRGLKAIISA